MNARFLLALALGCSFSHHSHLFAADNNSTDPGADSSAGLPPAYAAHYLISNATLSPDKKFAVIYPTLDYSDSKDARDFLVALQPFAVLTALPTKWPYFQNESHGGFSAQWSSDSTVALIVLDGKWGPRDAFAVELSGGGLRRITSVLEKVTQKLMPQFRSARPAAEHYNEYFAFIFGEDSSCTLEENKRVKLELEATTDPKGLSRRPWRKQVKAEWDIAQAKFVSWKITAAPRTNESDNE